MPQQDPQEKFMGFFEHLDELRVVFIRALLVFAGGFLFCYFVTNKWVMDWLRAPLFRYFPADQQKLYFTSLFENFLTHLKIAGYSSLFLFSPVYFSLFWSFIKPGLRPDERKKIIPIGLALVTFFLTGALFAYYVLFPIGFRFFVEFGLPGDTPLLTIDSYYSTCLKLMLLFGVSFELPVFIVVLGLLGLVSSKALREQRKNAILGITVLSALFAPPDAISMLVLMAPLILFYECALWIVAKTESKTSLSPHSVSLHAESNRNPDSPFRHNL